MGRAKAASKRTKDENKPKRAVSAYFYYLQHCREELKKSGKSVSKIGEFTKECSEKWNSLDDDEKKIFNDKAAKDKKRYESEMADYTGKPAKDDSKPKRPQTAYFLFLADYRKKMKDSDMSNKELIASAGKVWGEMKESEKKPYQDKNGAEVKKYEAEMKAWKEAGGGAASKPKKAKKGASNGVSDEDEEDEEDDEVEDEEEDEEEEDEEDEDDDE